MAEKWSLGGALRGMFVKPTIDETTWEDLETALLTADFGPDISERMIDELREKVERYRMVMDLPAILILEDKKLIMREMTGAFTVTASGKEHLENII